jgi:hypothetical protein
MANDGEVYRSSLGKYGEGSFRSPQAFSLYPSPRSRNDHLGTFFRYSHIVTAPSESLLKFRNPDLHHHELQPLLQLDTKFAIASVTQTLTAGGDSPARRPDDQCDRAFLLLNVFSRKQAILA